ncbi:hypothetical protein EBT16_14095 [bacterium]|nr:hypothetical protein [bacterium]
MNKVERLQFLLDLIQNDVSLGRGIEFSRANLKRAFDPKEVDEAIDAYILKLAVFGRGSPSVLRDRARHRHRDWYAQPLTTPDSHWALLREHLINKKFWTEQMIASLNASSDIVLANLAPPNADSRQKVLGLVLGYVQSGKTANFSAVIAKAADAGYKMVVVLAGVYLESKRPKPLRKV